MLTSQPPCSTCRFLPVMSLNSTPARSHSRSGRPFPSRYEPAPSPPASAGCFVPARSSIPNHLPEQGRLSFLLRHYSQLPELSWRPIPTSAVSPTIAPRSAHPGMVRLVALAPAILGDDHLYHPPLPSAPHVGGTGLDRRPTRLDS